MNNRRTQDKLTPNYWENLLLSQAGGGLDGFVGESWQRGGGFGSILRNIIKVISPVAKTGLKRIAKEGIKTGIGVARDALAGNNALESLEEHGKAGALNILNKMTKEKKSKTNIRKQRRRKMRGGGRKKRTTRRRRKIDILD